MLLEGYTEFFSGLYPRAYLEADTEKRLLNGPEFRLHPSEWNKRGRVWIIDFCCKSGFGQRVIAHFIQYPYGDKAKRAG